MADLYARLTAAVNARLATARGVRWGRVIGVAQYWDEPEVDFLADNRPADVTRHCERDLKVLERHKPWTDDVLDDDGHVLWWCTGCSNFGPLFRATDCDEITDLAAAYEVELSV